MKIYISIPMTGKNMDSQRKTALEWSMFFSNKGFMVVSPFILSDSLRLKHLSDNLEPPTYDEYLKFDLYNLQECTHIFLCNGWTESRGCMAEVDRAIELNLYFITESNIKVN